MSRYSSFAAVGAGPNIGKLIAEALSAKNASVVVLRRSSSVTDLDLPPSVKIVGVDYTDIESVASVLRDNRVEVVVSTLNNMAMDTQYQLADAAKLAGVKVFVPSEFGMPTDGTKAMKFYAHWTASSHLKSLGLNPVVFYNGLFMQWIYNMTGFEDNGKVNIVGKGETPWSFTDQEDVSGFVAHVLTTLPPSEFENGKIFRIEGQPTPLKSPKHGILRARLGCDRNRPSFVILYDD